MPALAGDYGDPQFDRELEHRVAMYLAGRQVSFCKELSIESRGGVVTLRGRVESLRAKRVGLSSAQRVAGVLRVVDEILIAPAGSAAASAQPRFAFSPALVRYFAERCA